MSSHVFRDFHLKRIENSYDDDIEPIYVETHNTNSNFVKRISSWDKIPKV